MIVFDTETTDLIRNHAMPLDELPEIIEFAACKVDPVSYVIVDRLEFLCKPKRPLKALTQQITHITPVMLENQLTFAAHLGRVKEFFLGERVLLAHNVAYDVDVLAAELRRLDHLTRFPWPPEQWCTAQLSMGVRGNRLKLGELFRLATGQEPVDAHRAMADVEMLVACLPWMSAQGLL